MILYLNKSEDKCCMLSLICEIQNIKQMNNETDLQVLEKSTFWILPLQRGIRAKGEIDEWGIKRHKVLSAK